MDRLKKAIHFIFWSNVSIAIGTSLILIGKSPNNSIIKEVVKKIESEEQKERLIKRNYLIKNFLI